LELMASESRLPDSYDRLAPVEQLHHDSKHNVRRVSPSEQLKRSIEKDGIGDALVARPGAEDALLITDGWQRYQAAVELGWGDLPVNVYKDTLAALEAAERESIVREWTTYQAARHVESVVEQLTSAGRSTDRAVQKAAQRTARTKPTVRRYLKAFRLPQDLHPLLKDRQNITAAEWQTLENYKENIRQYDGLSWKVAAEAGQYREELEDDRLRRVTLATVEHPAEDGKRLINEAVRDQNASLQMLRYRLFDGAGSEHDWIRIPQTGVRLNSEKKTAVMDYCSEKRVHLSDLVERLVKEFVNEVDQDEDGLDQYNS